ncbi:hypothetical protein, partial [Halorubrum yunnanense]
SITSNASSNSESLRLTAIQHSPSKRYSSEGDMSAMGTSRRQMLTASGLLAVGALSGCLGRVASATTNTGASPAAPFAGIGEYTGPSPTGDPTVYKLTPTVSGDSGLLSGEVELEAWVTAQALAAANYNNSRSNKSKIRGPGDADSDGDGIDDTVELRSKALELENQLLSQTKAAADSISKRSARKGPRGLADMGDTIEDIQATLERCSDDVCVTVRNHSDDRASLAQQAAEHVENGEWEAAAEDVQKIRGIVEGDIELLDSSLNDANTSGVTGEIILGEDRDMVMPGDNVGAVFDYLADEPILSELFTITVPDARVPGRDLALVNELTPRRIIEYVTGRADTEGKIYAWGELRARAENGGGNTSPIYEGDPIGGENVLNRAIMGDDISLSNSDVCLSALSGPVDTGIHLEVTAVDGRIRVHVVNDPPQATETTPALAVSADGSSVSPADFESWGSENGANSATPTLVCPIMVSPPDCPTPFPALLYVRRCKNADQYLYTGGWVIDDSSLYENSATLVDVGGPTEVLGVGAGDLDEDGYGDVVARSLSDDRERQGARLFDGSISDAVAQGVLSEAEGDDLMLRKRPGRTETEALTTDDVPVVLTHQGRLVHFSETNASDDVKFKAGAELSKSVN